MCAFLHNCMFKGIVVIYSNMSFVKLVKPPTYFTRCCPHYKIFILRSEPKHDPITENTILIVKGVTQLYKGLR